jgi:pimeloyl-ACP methyl ester carboxylesterase
MVFGDDSQQVADWHPYMCSPGAGRPFILLEMRHVSLRLCMRATGVDDIVRTLAAILKRHAVTSANFAGHSFGTLVVAHMRKIFPEAVSSVLLLDPVRAPICHSGLALCVFSFKHTQHFCFQAFVAAEAAWLESHVMPGVLPSTRQRQQLCKRHVLCLLSMCSTANA